MQESFLHFVWQYRQFDHSALATTQGEPLHIDRPGIYNRASGPDFSQARMVMAEVHWVGHVEIHIKASDWNTHKHQHDPAYNNVILHVVWENDREVYRQDGSQIPVLELKDRIDPLLISRFDGLMKERGTVLCQSQWQEVRALTKFIMMDRALTQRLERKSLAIRQMLRANNGDWEETAYQWLGMHFGFKLNNQSFLALTQSLPLKILARKSNDVRQIEAMIFGIAGLLENEPSDTYSAHLTREFTMLSATFGLQEKILPGHIWKFAGARPANFPTLRLAQFAMLITAERNLFSMVLDAKGPRELMEKLRIAPSDYWLSHYNFGKKKKSRQNTMGKLAMENLLINVAVPLMAAVGFEKDEQALIDKAVEWLQVIPAESNRILNTWKEVGAPAQNAYDSQAMIELHNEFCSGKKCLSCQIGAEIMKS
ncbi:DUF2851 family protein [Roseivirga sp. BDSF3-8]|uniref:DUF2851 family protein n=1 Tax=Roseivirga sp. BDSF3-8 TaxID=3241598 RepID=UPI003531A5C4